MNRLALKLILSSMVLGCSGVQNETGPVAEQTLDEAVRIFCYAPTDCAECDAEKDPARRQEKLVGFLEDRVHHPKIREIFKEAGQVHRDKTQSDISRQVKSLGFHECPLWDPGPQIRLPIPIQLPSQPSP